MAETVGASGLDLNALEKEWREAPADLAEWSMRAMRLLRVVALLEKELELWRRG